MNGMTEDDNMHYTYKMYDVREYVIFREAKLIFQATDCAVQIYRFILSGCFCIHRRQLSPPVVRFKVSACI